MDIEKPLIENLLKVANKSFSPGGAATGRARSQDDSRMMFALVSGVLDQAKGEELTRYVKYCLNLTLLVRRSGLAKLLCWLDARGEERKPGKGMETAEHWIAAQLSFGLARTMILSGALRSDYRFGGSTQLIADVKQGVLDTDMDGYLLFSRRTMELGEWFKLYAEKAAETIDLDGSDNDGGES